MSLSSTNDTVANTFPAISPKGVVENSFCGKIFLNLVSTDNALSFFPNGRRWPSILKRAEGVSCRHWGDGYPGVVWFTSTSCSMDYKLTGTPAVGGALPWLCHLSLRKCPSKAPVHCCTFQWIKTYFCSSGNVSFVLVRK